MSTRTTRRYLVMGTFLLPSFALIVLFSYYPALSGLLHAFTNWDIGGKWRITGLENFVSMWRDRVFIASMTNMLKYTAFHVVAYTVVPLTVALLIFHARSDRARYWFRVCFLIPYVVPSVVYWLVWSFIYAPYDGILNNLIRAVGVKGFKQAWLGNPDTALGAVMFIGFPFVGAFFMLILYAGLEGIGQAIFDAAEIDGARTFARLFRIELPLILPQAMLIIILGAIEGFSSYDVVLLLTSGGPMNSTMFPGLYMYQNAFRFGRMGYACAIGTLLFAVLFALAMVSQRYRSRT